MSPEMQARWNQLTQAEQDKVLEAHRDWNVYDEWWDSVYEAFRERCGELGIRVGAMYFSGFWNQGDGACFEGQVQDWETFFAHCKLDQNAALMAWYRATRDDWSFSCQHRGYYYHEQSVSFSCYLPDEDDNPYDPDLETLQHHMLAACCRSLDRHQIESTMEEAFRDLMRELYRDLETEYEYLTSEEAILEVLDANDMLEGLIDEALRERDPGDEGVGPPELGAHPPGDNPGASNFLLQSI